MSDLWGQVALEVEQLSYTTGTPGDDPANILADVNNTTYEITSSTGGGPGTDYQYGTPLSIPPGDGAVIYLYSVSDGYTTRETWTPIVTAKSVTPSYDVNSDNTIEVPETDAITNTVVGVVFGPGPTLSQYVLVPESVESSIVVPTGDSASSYISNFDAALTTINFGTIAGGVEFKYPAYEWVDLGAISTLFTTGDDTVDFNNLTADQQAAVAGGADLYDGLGGDDVVTLPSAANYDESVGDGKTLGWDPSQSFSTGSLAGQTYTIYGSPGDHIIAGGLGQETYNYTAGDFANFAGFPTTGTTTQTITGGHIVFQTGSAQDLIKLPGSPNDYSVATSVGGSWSSTSTTISTKNVTLQPVTLNTSEVEDVEFANPITNVVQLKGGNLTEEMAALAGDAYDNTPSDEISRNWLPLSAIELGMDPVGLASSGNTYTMVDGEYTDSGPANTENASVMVGLIGGISTLALSFRGTDSIGDIVDYPSFVSLIGAKFGPLISALQTYIAKNHIQQVLIDGHSLGGALAQAALSENWGVSASMVKAYTWGSPGAENAAALANPNIENFEHINDPVPGTEHLFPNQTQAGAEILIDSIQVPGPTNAIKAHSIGYPDLASGAYFSDSQWLVQLASGGSDDSFFDTTSLASDLVDGAPYTGSTPVEIMPGNPAFGSQLDPSDGADDYIIGGSGNDQIHIDVGSLLAVGKSGNRIIDGGGGNNIFFLPYGPSNYVFSANEDGGTIVTVAGSSELVATLYNIQEIDFADGSKRPLSSVASSILWQNTSGQAALWDMNGTSVAGGGTVSANPGPSWKTIGTGDFFGSGDSGMLWQSSNGQVAIWEMNGTNIVGGGTIASNPGPAWQAIGTGDFNDDGHSDILWQSANGQVAVWEMNGTHIVGGGTIASNPGAAWKAVGTGDFNADGHSDILWQSANGQVAVWEMNGSNITGGGTLTANPGPSWKAIGTGDFNDDAHSDILFQNTSGQLAIWEMNGINIIGGGVISADPGPSWQAIGTGGEGSPDILFQSTSGQAAIWEMNGTAITGGGVVSANPGTSWKAIGLA